VRRFQLSGWTILVVLGLIALAVTSFHFPGRRHVALDAFVLYLGALGLAAAGRATRAANPDVHEPTLDDELDDHHEALGRLPERPAELARLEREVHLSLGSAYDLHHRLRPLLREVAAHRLLMRHGIDSEARPDAAAAILGDTTWAWLRPDRPEPRDRWTPGPSLAEVRALVDAIENL
jgi:hypothetical protein